MNFFGVAVAGHCFVTAGHTKAARLKSGAKPPHSKIMRGKDTRMSV